MSEDYNFPLDMIHPPSGIVVRMESKQGNNGTGTITGTGQRNGTGSISVCGGGIYDVGYRSRSWSMCMFEPLHKKRE